MINRIAGIAASERSQGGKESSWHLKAPNVKQWMEPVEGYITQNPAAAIATAFVIGVALAWWIKRK